MLDIVISNIKEQLHNELIVQDINVYFQFDNLIISIILSNNDIWSCQYVNIVPQLQRGLPSKEIVKDCLKKYEIHILSKHFKRYKCS